MSVTGILLSLLASALFALIPAYVLWLVPLDGLQISAWRVIWILPGLLVLLMLTGGQPSLRDACARLRHEPLLRLALLAAAFLLALQWLVFILAPLVGRTLDIALGYFLLPLAMVLSGRLFYGERLHRLQQIALLLAAVGVVHELCVTRALSLYTLVAACGYVPYFMLRRWMRLQALPGLLLEMLVLLPFALMWLVLDEGWPAGGQAWLQLAGLGVLSALAFGALLGANQHLDLGVLGVFSYVEPALLFLVAVWWLHEPFHAGQLLTYGPIWAAVLLVVLHSLWELQRRHACAAAAQP